MPCSPAATIIINVPAFVPVPAIPTVTLGQWTTPTTLTSPVSLTVSWGAVANAAYYTLNGTNIGTSLSGQVPGTPGQMVTISVTACNSTGCSGQATATSIAPVPSVPSCLAGQYQAVIAGLENLQQEIQEYTTSINQQLTALGQNPCALTVPLDKEHVGSGILVDFTTLYADLALVPAEISSVNGTSYTCGYYGSAMGFICQQNANGYLVSNTITGWSLQINGYQC